jgi:hypothetical protein
MSLRTFIFCDYCNPSAIRTIEARRIAPRPFGLSGRRFSDGRSWFDGSREQALAAGWSLNDDGQDICPRCLQRGLGTHPEVPEPPNPSGA